MQLNPLEVSVGEQGKRLVAAPNAFQPLALRAMFWRPNFSAEAQWLEHVPFAFWLMEAARPRVVVELGAGPAVSYFAFCQAVERLELETRCFAVHPWPAAGGAGAPEAEAFEKIHAYNESQYARFSRLVRSEPQAAVHQFANGSIDLLHVSEGLATFTADDLDGWLPKLSDRGVLLVHGTAKSEGAARRIVDRLRPEYRAFEFAHSNGLALVAIGTEQPDLLKFLWDAGQNDSAQRAVHEVFFRLGRACADSHAVVREKAQARRLGDAVARQQREVDLLRAELQQAQQSVERKTTELRLAQDNLDAQVEERAVERGQLAEKVTLLQEIRADLKSELERIGSRLDAAQADLLLRAEQAARLEQAGSAREAQLEQARAGLQQRDEKIAALQQASAQEQSELAAMRQQAAGRAAELQERTAEAATLGQRIGALEAMLAESEVQRNALLGAKQKLAEENLRLEEAVSLLTQQKAQQELVAQGVAAEHAQRAEEARGAAKALQDRIAALENARAQAETELAGKAQGLAARQEEVARLRNDLAQEQRQVGTLKDELRGREARLGELEEQVRRTQAELQSATAAREALEHQLEDRFRELAELTSALMREEEEGKTTRGRLATLQQEFARLLEQRDGGSREVFNKMLGRAGQVKPEQVMLLKSGLFDPAWYLREYPDVAGKGMDPVKHYLRFGAAENRDPGPHFSTARYVASHRDTLAPGENPLLHFIAHESGDQQTSEERAA